MVESEAEVWSRVRLRSDRAAFTELYERHADRVYSHLRRRGLDQHHAEDVTGDVFVETWRQRDRIVVGPDDSLLAWLLAVANNLLRKHWRRNEARRRAFERFSSLDDGVDPIGEYVDWEGDRYALGVILQVLDHLGDADREVIELCVVEGLVPTTVAAALGQPPPTVRSRLSRALQRARKLYAEYTVERGDLPRKGSRT